ncbi:MAG: ferrous iron transport protein B [Methanospirillaceae archaeon]|nr:ferrous iron transport protein B [Methanospirillaceae archaeon]
MKEIRILLAGNPNVGKTTLFNSLCGVHQHTGNYPGVTVEIKEGKREAHDHSIIISDLPGTYSLSAFTPDEQVARDALLTSDPDVIVQIVDATNIERNLFFTTQLLEIGIPLVIALNMCDLADEQGITIDDKCLGKNLNIPVVRVVAKKGEGIQKLVDTIIEAAETTTKPDHRKIEYPHLVTTHIDEIGNYLSSHASLLKTLSPHYAAIRLLEGDEHLLTMLHEKGLDIPFIDKGDPAERDGITEDILLARYRAAEKVTTCSVMCTMGRVMPADLIDQVLTHRIFGIPIFLSCMWFAFQLTFSASNPFLVGIEYVWGYFTKIINGIGMDPLIRSFLSDGVIGGVGSVLVFVPSIFVMFIILSILEDSGYLARAAFVMDRFMHSIGLHGRSFIPFLIGFGCNVPAIMATRTLQSRADRFITIITIPFMSCAARLPVYVLFAGVFFGAAAGNVIFFLYVLGILVAIVSALIFRRVVFKDEPSPFIMELPPYRMPGGFTAVLHMWYKGREYLKRAGIVIFGGVLVVWALATLPAGVEYGSAESLAGIIGQAVEPLFAPLGFNWQLVVGLIFGFIAKEVVVGSLGTLYGGEDMLESSLAADPTISPAIALAYMVFVLLYMPCVAALGVIRQEMGNWKWTAIAIGWGILMAYLFAFILLHVGSLFIGA